MFPLWDILGWLIRLVPGVMFDPSRAGLFWLVVLLVAMQYRRMAATERAVYGELRQPVWQHTLISAIQGLIAGLIGSLLIVLLGVTLTGTGLLYLLPVALLLMLISPRLLCFSYAGGLLSVLYLLTGFPPVYVPGLMGLVAALHATESLLILISGHGSAIALPLKTPGGSIAAGFSLQRFWPVPIVVLWLAEGTGVEGVSMPGWWPLIKPASELLEQGPELVFFLLPVVAVLGYADISVSSRPERKPAMTAGWLLAYSLVLMALAVGASHYGWLLWPVALFGPLGHELVIKIGNRREFGNVPWLTPSPDGVTVLDVIRGSFADRLGVKRGDVILRVNQEPVFSVYEVTQLLMGSVFGVELDIRRSGRELTVVSRNRPRDDRWGIAFLPRAGEGGVVELQRGGMLSRWLSRLGRRRRQ